VRCVSFDDIPVRDDNLRERGGCVLEAETWRVDAACMVHVEHNAEPGGGGEANKKGGFGGKLQKALAGS